jgi:hypothetical protein
MRRLAPLLAILMTSACDGDSEPPASAERRTEAGPVPDPALAPAAPTTESREEEVEDAGAALRRYYDLIEAGDYEAAWRMRGLGDEGAEAFARNFAAYERYRVTLGPASRPVESKGWLYVEVPIQIAGRMKGGKPFGSVGSVTMRRPTPGTGRESEGWRIYTG